MAPPSLPPDHGAPLGPLPPCLSVSLFSSLPLPLPLSLSLSPTPSPSSICLSPSSLGGLRDEPCLLRCHLPRLRTTSGQRTLSRARQRSGEVQMVPGSGPGGRRRGRRGEPQAAQPGCSLQDSLWTPPLPASLFLSGFPSGDAVSGRRAQPTSPFTLYTDVLYSVLGFAVVQTRCSGIFIPLPGSASRAVPDKASPLFSLHRTGQRGRAPSLGRR